jgi:hypothetical protein
MSDGNSEALLQQILDTLRENQRKYDEYREKVTTRARATLRDRPDFKKEMEESKRSHEQWLKEQRDHQASVIAELKSISDLLRQLIDCK